MSWGQAVTEGASGAGSAATSAASSAVGSSAGSITGQVAEAGGGAASNAAPAAGGFSMDAASTPAATGAGPTVDAGNMQTYGTTDPSYLQQAGNALERFQAGGNQSMGTAVEKFGNNPETYGYLYGKANQISGMAGKQGGGGAAPITTNITYQQPVNPYLAKRGRY